MWQPVERHLGRLTLGYITNSVRLGLGSELMRNHVYVIRLAHDCDRLLRQHEDREEL